MDQHEIGGIGDELPDWLRGIGDASILRRSRNDIERTGVTREPAGVAVIVAHTLRDWPADAVDASSTDSPLFGNTMVADDDEAAMAAAVARALAVADDA